MPRFDLIPADDLEIDQPCFKASKPQLTIFNGELRQYSQCYEWVGGKWEGFVAIERFGDRRAQKRALRRDPLNVVA